MGSEQEGNQSCSHCWRRLTKRELCLYDNPKYHVICSLCGIVTPIPFDLFLYYDIYFSSFPEDEDQ